MIYFIVPDNIGELHTLGRERITAVDSGPFQRWSKRTSFCIHRTLGCDTTVDPSGNVAGGDVQHSITPGSSRDNQILGAEKKISKCHY